MSVARKFILYYRKKTMEVLQENVNSAKGEKIAEAIAKFSIQPNQTLFSVSLLYTVMEYYELYA